MKKFNDQFEFALLELRAVGTKRYMFAATTQLHEHNTLGYCTKLNPIGILVSSKHETKNDGFAANALPAHFPVRMAHGNYEVGK